MSALLALTLAAAPRVLAPSPGAWTTQPSVRVFVETGGAPLALVRDDEGSGPAPHACCGPGVGSAPLALEDGGITCTPGLAADGGVAALWHCTVALRPGRNALRASAADASVDFSLTRFDTLLSASASAPGVGGDALGTAVHQRDVEARCAGCHEMKDAEARRDGGSPLGTACTGCHDYSQRRTVHGPVGQGECLACHDAAAEPRYGVRWPMQDTCFKCHADIRGAMNEKAFRHGPAAAGRCTTCHDPHGSEHPFWLKKAPFDLCTTCHLEKRDERHVVVGFVYGDSHPLRDRPHPLKPQTQFACPSCHNPHAAKARFLWQFDVTRRETLCRTCHQK